MQFFLIFKLLLSFSKCKYEDIIPNTIFKELPKNKIRRCSLRRGQEKKKEIELLVYVRIKAAELDEATEKWVSITISTRHFFKQECLDSL